MVVLVDLAAVIVALIVLIYICASVWEQTEADKKRKEQRHKDKERDAKIQEKILYLYTTEGVTSLVGLVKSRPKDIESEIWCTNINRFADKYNIDFTVSLPKRDNLDNLKEDVWD